MKSIAKFVIPVIMCIAVFCSMVALNPHIGYYDIMMVSEAMDSSFAPALSALQYSVMALDVIEVLDETLREASGGLYRVTADVIEQGDGRQVIWVEGETWSINGGWEMVVAVSRDIPAGGRVDPYYIEQLTNNLDSPLFGLNPSPFTAFAGLAIQSGFLIGKGAFETLGVFLSGVLYIVGVTDSPF